MRDKDSSQLKLVENIDEINTAIRHVKTGRKYCTNFCFSYDKLQVWIDKKELRMFLNENTLVMVREHLNYNQGYFWTSDLSSLKNGLSYILSQYPILSMDVPHFENTKIDYIPILEQVGMKKRTTLRRMVRVNHKKEFINESNIEYPAMEEAASIQNILVENFDLLYTQIPDLDEIEHSISEKEIIISREQEYGEIAAFFWTERVGKVGHFRYWIAQPKYRNMGNYGMVVYKQAMLRNQDLRKFDLLVREDNDMVIKIHLLHHFRYDGMVNDAYVYQRNVEGR